MVWQKIFRKQTTTKGTSYRFIAEGLFLLLHVCQDPLAEELRARQVGSLLPFFPQKRLDGKEFTFLEL